MKVYWKTFLLFLGGVAILKTCVHSVLTPHCVYGHRLVVYGEERDAGDEERACADRVAQEVDLEVPGGAVVGADEEHRPQGHSQENVEHGLYEIITKSSQGKYGCKKGHP